MGCIGLLGILRYSDERFILSSLHSRHLLRGVRAIFELSLSLSLSSSVSLCVSARLSLSPLRFLPLDPPSWSSAVHSGRQGSTSVPRWFSVHTRIPTRVALRVFPDPLVARRWLRFVHAWTSSYSLMSSSSSFSSSSSVVVMYTGCK